MLSNEIISRLMPESLPSADEVFRRYPPRNLPEGAMITRIAPSPTGYVHIGAIFNALLDERFAHQSGGVYYMRLEDTDSKREIEGASEMLLNAFGRYQVPFDEGLDRQMNDVGAYGPYQQSKRRDIYKVFIKEFLQRGLAYPAFETHEELEEMRSAQEACKSRPGYHGEWAKSRFLSEDEIRERLDAEIPFVIRFRSPGNPFKKMKIDDLLKGVVEMAENDIDIVIMKQDGLPTYHFAHLVDDRLMGTTHVIRGDEWLASVPLHIQLFESFGWDPPRYAHIAPIQKIDENGNRRKLSKRKDPEASMGFYEDEGYPVDAILDYLYNLANSDFEDWRKQHPDSDRKEFPITFAKLKSHSGGALFDFVKLESVSKEAISRYSAQRVYDEVLAWSASRDPELHELLTKYPEYAIRIFSIERSGEKVRKDISKWKEVRDEISFFFDELFAQDTVERMNRVTLSKDTIAKIVTLFTETLDFSDDRDQWFEKLKDICPKIGFAQSIKEYKADPERFGGSIVDIAGTLRILLTGKARSPDLHAVMQVLGEERVLKRLNSMEE